MLYEVITGGALFADTVTLLDQHGIPVCAHLGLTPQSIHKLGGYRVQGKDQDSAKQIVHDALVITSYSIHYTKLYESPMAASSRTVSTVMQSRA